MPPAAAAARPHLPCRKHTTLVLPLNSQSTLEARMASCVARKVLISALDASSSCSSCLAKRMGISFLAKADTWE